MLILSYDKLVLSTLFKSLLTTPTSTEADYTMHQLDDNPPHARHNVLLSRGECHHLLIAHENYHASIHNGLLHNVKQTEKKFLDKSNSLFLDLSLSKTSRPFLRNFFVDQ